MRSPVEGVHLDLDRDRRGEVLHEPVRLGDAPGRGDVVVLHQRHVEQAHAMVDPAPAAHGVLLERPQAGRGLACVAHPGTGSGQCLDPAVRQRRHARQVTQQVERGAFGGEEQAGRRRHSSDLGARFDHRPVGHELLELAGGRPAHDLDDRRRDGQAGDHTVRTSTERGRADEVERDGRHRRDVDPVGEVLVEGDRDQPADSPGVQSRACEHRDGRRATVVACSIIEVRRRRRALPPRRA